MKILRYINKYLYKLFINYKTSTMGIIIIFVAIYFALKGQLEIFTALLAAGIGLLNSKDLDKKE